MRKARLKTSAAKSTVILEICERHCKDKKNFSAKPIFEKHCQERNCWEYQCWIYGALKIKRHCLVKHCCPPAADIDSSIAFFSEATQPRRERAEVLWRIATACVTRDAERSSSDARMRKNVRSSLIIGNWLIIIIIIIGLKVILHHYLKILLGGKKKKSPMFDIFVGIFIRQLLFMFIFFNCPKAPSIKTFKEEHHEKN